ncbi:hypothetical protein [uncultured Ruminococcus sp.]|nr:hypothetical protein [uncultured Ruminococcus sp.]
MKYIFTKAPNLNPGESPDCLLPWNVTNA